MKVSLCVSHMTFVIAYFALPRLKKACEFLNSKKAGQILTVNYLNFILLIILIRRAAAGFHADA